MQAIIISVYQNFYQFTRNFLYLEKYYEQVSM